MFHTYQTYNTFISHSWDYREHYNTILSWLRESNISIKDYSISVDKALPVMSKILLKAQITEKIGHASVVIIISGMYAAYSEWIDYEINEAVRMGKPILGIYLWGQERAPRIVTDNADKIVHWNKNSVVQGFKDLV